MNVVGVKELIKLCREMKKLVVNIHTYIHTIHIHNTHIHTIFVSDVGNHALCIMSFM